MGDNEKSCFWISCIISICLGLVAIALALPRYAGQLSFDYQGIYVAVFAAFVTCLIGWQIFVALDFSKKMDKAKEDFSRAIEKVTALDSALEGKSKTLEELNYGMYFISSAAINYIQARHSTKERYSMYATSYILNLRGIKHLLRSGTTTEESGYMFNFASSVLEIIIKKFESDLSTHHADIKLGFNASKHTSAEEEFYGIVLNKDMLKPEIWRHLDDIHNRRIGLRKNCGL